MTSLGMGGTTVSASVKAPTPHSPRVSIALAAKPTMPVSPSVGLAAPVMVVHIRLSPFAGMAWPSVTRHVHNTGRGIRRARQGPGQRVPGSPVLELRLTLFREGRHPFLLVLGGEQRVEKPPFKQDPLGQPG